jgi:hypothetical protein
MACTPGILAAIISTCDTQLSGGVEAIAWAWNRTQMTLTYDGTTTNKITNIAAISTNKIYKVTGVKNLFGAGHSIVTAENRANRWKHKVNLELFEKDVAKIFAQDNIDDIVFCIELKDKGSAGDGTFFVYGAQYGLYVTADDRDTKTEQGVRKMVLESMSQQEEKHSAFVLLKTDYAATLALLEGLD